MAINSTDRTASAGFARRVSSWVGVFARRPAGVSVVDRRVGSTRQRIPSRRQFLPEAGQKLPGRFDPPGEECREPGRNDPAHFLYLVSSGN